MVYPNGRRVDYAYNDGGQLAVVDDHGAAGDPIAAYDTIGGRVLRRAMENGIDLDYRDGSGTLYDAAARLIAFDRSDENSDPLPAVIPDTRPAPHRRTTAGRPMAEVRRPNR